MGANSTRTYHFVQVDVFTDRVFGGNPLAVFLDGRGLTDGEMQAIANEMNLSETTFLLPATHPGRAARVRIFTPGREVPFAGHPTIGTSFVMATHGLLAAEQRHLALEEGIGPVEVTIEGEPHAPSFLWMRHRDAVFGPELSDRAGIASALGLSGDDMLTGAPVQTGSTGLGFLYIPLRGPEAVDRAVLDAAALSRCVSGEDSTGVFLLAPDPDPSAGRVYSRMFAPQAGVPEDPATGSASGPLGAYLVRHGLVKQGEHVQIVSEQGTKMGRQSFLHIRLRATTTGPTDIEVGGSVAPVLEGTLHLPRRQGGGTTDDTKNEGRAI
jgi:trans-2,3-dihydro-3-hydroxyanthranilate isomerase